MGEGLGVPVPESSAAGHSGFGPVLLPPGLLWSQNVLPCSGSAAFCLCGFGGGVLGP